MALPKPNASWPPENPLSGLQKDLMVWYSGQDPISHVKIENKPKPDPAGVRPSANSQTKTVHSNIVADLANVSAELVMGRPPRISVDENSDVNTLLTPEQADASQTGMTALCERSGTWGVFRAAAELAAVTGEVYIRVVADPTILEDPIIETVPSVNVDPTFRYGKLVSARMWTTVGTEGYNVLRWVEERDNQARVIRNGLYMGTDSNIGQIVPLSSHPATSGLMEIQEYPEGIDEMVWHFPNAKPSRTAPETPHGRSNFEGSESLISSLNLVYTSMARDLRLGQARLVIPTASLSRGMNGSAVWENSREIFTDLDLDPTNPSSKPELMQPVLRMSEHIDAANEIITRIVEAAGISPQTVGLGDTGVATSGIAIRLQQAKTLAYITAWQSLWGPGIARVIETQAKLSRIVHGNDIIPSRFVPKWPELVTPDPEVTARTVQLYVVAGAYSTETAVKMAQPELSALEVAAEVARIREEKAAGVSSQTQNNEASVDPNSDMVTIAPEDPSE